MNQQLLRAGLLLDSWTMPAWAHEAIRRVAVEGQTQWSLVILNKTPPPQLNLVQRVWESRHTALASSYLRLDQIVSPAARDPLAPCDAKPLLASVPCMEATPQVVDGFDRYCDADIVAIKAHRLDVVVHLGSNQLRGKILNVARMGVWSFQHGNNGADRPEFAGLWEVVENRDVNRSTLEILADESGRSLVLAQICSAVDQLSASRNRSNLYWPAVSLLPRQLARLYRLGHAQFRTDVTRENTAATPCNQPTEQPLTNRTLLPGLWKLGLRRLRRKWTKQFCREQWFLLSYFDRTTVGAASRAAPGTANSVSTRTSGPARLAGPTEFQEIVPPRDRFWADPHVVERDGKHYVFFEEYLYRSGKAHISVMECDDRGHWQPPRTVLERPYHLSYPFLFTWQGEQYMIPETSANRTLEIYRCDEFPDRWSLHKVVWNNVSAYDATLVEHAGHWWMFVTLAENEGGSSSDELFLFHADHPLSDHWIPHPSNPIVSDVRRARPAGPLFMRDGVLHRPAQDCSHTYGYGIRLHRIEELSPTSYVETEVDRIEPLEKSGWQAVHTLSFAGGLTMMDAQRRRLKFGGNKPSPLGRGQGEGAGIFQETPSPQPSP